MSNRILIIEDDIELRENLKEILEYKNFEIWTADDGKSALKILENTVVDLIISDILMPNLGGLGVLSEIKLLKGFENTPFILLTGKASSEDQRYGIEQGADDYLIKPVAAEVLLNAVFASLGKKNKRETWAKNKLETGLKEDRKITFHEFRTPLAGVNSIFELMELLLDNFDKEEFDKLIQTGKESVNRINNTLNKLAIFNRLDHIVPSVSNFIFDIELLKKICEKKFNKLELFSWDSDILISFDLDHFNLIINELVDNAIKFSPLESPIYVALQDSVFCISNYQKNHQDIGAFEPKAFSQINRMNIEQQGLGIGLFICKKLANLNNAVLECEIAYDSRFYVNIIFSVD
jgi:DNA-binding response OmpR family regulator